MQRYLNTPYFVTECGEIFREGSTYPLTKEQLKNGYERVSLSINGKVNRVGVHIMVATCYVDNPYNKKEVNHIDHIRNHNHKDNLEWVTHSENMLHCHNAGRCSNIIASNAAKEANKIKVTTNITKLLGDNLVNINHGRRTEVTFICPNCLKQFTRRSDNPAIKRGGICRSCVFKMKI